MWKSFDKKANSTKSGLSRLKDRPHHKFKVTRGNFIYRILMEFANNKRLWQQQ
jgi:hypothetical protein